MRVFDEGTLCLQDSHVHDVCFMQRLVFDLWVDDGWVWDPCGVGIIINTIYSFFSVRIGRSVSIQSIVA